jgi:ribosomal protein S3AE
MAQAKRKKRFFDVEIPIINRETQLQAYEIEELNGRMINYDLTRLLKGKSAVFQLSVKNEDGELIATPRQIKVLPYFLRRMMRKGTNYVEDSFSMECKDAVVRIKPFLITRRKVSRNVRRILREKTKEELAKYMKEKDSEVIFEDIIKNDLQRHLSLVLKKVYPLSLCEIRIFKIEKDLGTKVVVKRAKKGKTVSESESEEE